MKIGNRNYDWFGYLDRKDYLTPEEDILMETWGNFLSKYSWEWFVVLTFKHNVGLDQAKKRFKKWFRSLNRRREKQIGDFTIIQWHADERRLHIHSLMLGVGNSSCKTWERKWRFGNHPEIRKYKVEKRGVFYLAKMIAKGQARDYFFGGILENTKYCKDLLALSNMRN